MVKLIAFDKSIRILIWDHIEYIENYLKSIISYHLAETHGIFCQEKSELFFDTNKHAIWLQGIHKETERSRERFLKHFKRTYKNFPTIPLWVVVEVMSLGKISHLYTNIKRSDKMAIAKEIGIHSSLLGNWLHVLTYIRNMCAHHGRIWNRDLAIKPVLPKQLLQEILNSGKIASVLFVLKVMMSKIPSKETEFCDYKSSVNTIVTNTTSLNSPNPLKRMGIHNKEKFLRYFQ